MIASSVKIWATASDWVEFQYGQARVEYPQIGERILDRRGLVHWVRPSIARYPSKLVVTICPEELLEMNSSPSAPRSVLAWLEYQFRCQAELMVFVAGGSLAAGGEPVERRHAYLCRIVTLPPELSGTLPRAGDYPETIELELAVHEDGAFGDINDFSSYQAYVPARPGTGS